MTDAPVEIVAHDPPWPERFARGRALAPTGHRLDHRSARRGT